MCPVPTAEDDVLLEPQPARRARQKMRAPPRRLVGCSGLLSLAGLRTRASQLRAARCGARRRAGRAWGRYRGGFLPSHPRRSRGRNKILGRRRDCGGALWAAAVERILTDVLGTTEPSRVNSAHGRLPASRRHHRASATRVPHRQAACGTTLSQKP